MMNIQSRGTQKSEWALPGHLQARTVSIQQPTSEPQVLFGNKFKDEIKDTKGLVKENGKGIGLFSYIFSQGTFPLKMISELSMDLDPAKKKHIQAYNQLLHVALRPSAAPILRDLEAQTQQAKGMVARNINAEALVKWMDAGKAPLSALTHTGNAEVVQNWMQEGYNTLSSLKTDSKSLQVLAKDMTRSLKQLEKWIADDRKALKSLENPSPDLKHWLETFHLTTEGLKTAVVDAHEMDQDAYVPPVVFQRMRDIGLLRLKVPKEYGGLDLHQKEYHRVIRELPKVSGTLGALVSAHSTIGSAPLVLNGTKAQQEEYLPKIAEGNYLAAFGLTEPGAGTDTKKLKTTATLSPDGKEWIINGEEGFGEKIFITNTHRSGIMFLMVKTDLGEHFGKPGENAMIGKWLHANVQSKRNPKGTLNVYGDLLGTQYPKGEPWKHDPKDRSGKSINFDYIREQHPDKPWKNLSNKMLKESIIILDLPFRLSDSKEDRAEKMKEMADRGMVIADPLELMMIRGSNQAFIRFNDFRVPVNKVLGGVGEDVQPLLEMLSKHKNDAAVPGLDWRSLSLTEKKDGKPVTRKLKLDGAGMGMTDVFNALNRGRAGFGPSYAGAVRGMLEASRKYALKREMFDLYGGQQADMPVIKKYLGDMAMKSAALDALSELTSALIEEKGDKMNIIDICAAVKVLSTDWNWDVAQLAMKIHGGTGTRRGHESGMERAFRDAWIGLIVEGVNEAMKQVVVGVGATPALESKDALLARLAPPWTGKFWTQTLTTPFSQEFRSLIRGTKPAVVTESGDLDSADARWIQSRTKELWRKSSAWGAQQGEAMMSRQNELIRLSDIALDLYALAAVHLKLKKSTDIAPEEKVSLQEFVTVARRRIDRNLDDFSYFRENPDDKSARKSADAHFDAEKILLDAAKEMYKKQ